MLEKILKRDGEQVPFEPEKITVAIRKAFVAQKEKVSNEDLTILTEDVVFRLTDEHTEEGDVTVEIVQNHVEYVLMENGHFKVAKAYIVYREEHARLRAEQQLDLVQQFEEKKLTVKKRNGKKETFTISKIKKVFDRAAEGCGKKCSFEIFIEAFKKNIVPDMTTADITRLMSKTAIDLVTTTNVGWLNVASRISLGEIYKEACRNRKMTKKDIYTPKAYLSLFKEYIKKGLYYKDFMEYYSEKDILEAGKHLSKETDEGYEYTTVLSCKNRYLLNPNGIIKEMPQEMYMSVALFLAIPEKEKDRLPYALKLYKYISGQYISLPTPTLLNSRTNWHQLSSCFKINVDDDLRAIYHAVENMSQISKFGGGVGVYLGNIRARESAIRGFKGASGGVNPWIKVINDTAVAVNQLGARMGAISVTLDVWHRDIYDFLDLQTETGDIRMKAFDVFPAISVPDLFMKRVEESGDWTLFDPHEIDELYGKSLQDHFGKDFDAFYEELEQDKRLTMKRVVPAKDIFIKHLRTVVETGMPYVFFRDTVNKLNPNKHAGNIYSTQLCTEICQNTSRTKFIEEVIEDGKIVIRYEPGDLVVCNLASINVAKVNDEKTIKAVFPVVFRALDNVITLNYYPIKEAERTSKRYRSVGLGYLGLAEYLAVNHLSYESKEARKAVDELFEKYAFHTYKASHEIAKERKPYELFKGSEYSKGVILGKKSAWFEKNTPRGKEWKQLIENIKKDGVRFAYHTAPAPNTSTAGVVGTTAALLPIYKRYFVENNLSAPTVRVAPKLSLKNFEYYKEYIAMDMKDVIDMIGTIYPWVDQSISFEWMIDPATTSPSMLRDYYFRAWKKGIKTVYYVRSLSGNVSDTTCDSCSG